MATQAPKGPPERAAAPARKHGFFDQLAALFRSDDPEKQKQRRLREIAGELRHVRLRFYNPVKGTTEPGLPRFFYEIYKTVAAAQVLLKGAEVSGALKQTLVEICLSESQRGLKDRLVDASIDERARSGADPAVLEAEVAADLKAFQESITTAWMNDVDALYNRLLVVLDLVGFDYFFLLRRFDPALPERDFAYTPRFESQEISAVLGELQDFLEILPSVDPDADWDRMLAILKEHRGMETIARDAVRRTVGALREAQRSGALLLTVRHALQNPAWKPMVRTHRERIVEPYVAKLKAEADASVKKVASGKRNEKIEELARAVFGTSSVPRLAHYAESANPEFTQKMLGGYRYVSALNYLRAFLVDFLPKSIREVVDLLIIKGKWTDNQPSQQMSEAYHQLLKVHGLITRFDADLADDGELGRRMKSFAVRAEKDAKAHAQLRSALQQVNDEAHMMIGDAVQHFVSVARVLKIAHEDVGRNNPAYLMNWKDLRPPSNRDLRSVIAAVYRKIYTFVQLMQMFR
jgi:hypothetical protein